MRKRKVQSTLRVVGYTRRTFRYSVSELDQPREGIPLDSEATTTLPFL